MALDINFSENYGQGITGIHDAKIGKLMTPLKMYIQGESDALATSKAQKDLETVFHMTTSDGFADSFTVADTLGMMENVAAGNGPGNQRTNETGQKAIYNAPFMIETSVSRQLIDDSRGRLTANIQNIGRSIPSSYYKTRSYLGINALVNASHGNKSFKYVTGNLSHEIDTTTYDGKPLFSKSHTYGVGSDRVKNGKGDTQSNAFYVKATSSSGSLVTAGNIQEYLNAMATKLTLMKDESGLPMGYVGDILLVPMNRIKLVSALKTAVGTERAAGSNNNDINLVFGHYTIVATEKWMSDKDEIIMISDDANRLLGGNMFLDRKKLDIKSWEDGHTRNLIMNGYARWGIGFNTYKHAVALTIYGSNDAADTDNCEELT